MRAVGCALLCVLALGDAAWAAPPSDADVASTDVAALEKAADEAWASAEKARDPATRTATFRKSAALYRRAHELAPRFSRIRNAASAWKHAGDEALAADALELALGLSLAAADRAEVERLLAELRQRLTRLTVRGPRGSRVTLSQSVLRSTPFTMHVVPGRVALEALFDGGASTRVEVVADPGKDVELQLVAPTSSAGPASRGATAPPPAPSSPGTESSDERTPRVVVGGVLVGVGGALAVSTVVTTILGKNAYDEYRHYASILAAEPANAGAAAAGNEQGDEAKVLRTASWITGLTGGACLAAGIVVLITAPAAPGETPAHGETVARVVPCAIGAGLGACGTF